MQELTLAVVGIAYPNADKSNRRFEVELCRPGDPIELRPEPRNKADPLAIGVWREGGGQLGYLTAERCGWVSQRMAAEGLTAIFQGFDGSTAFIRARFGEGLPTLPASPIAVRRAEEPEVDFYPDPEGPEFGA